MIFDLWDTLALWRQDAWNEVYVRMAEHLALDVEDFRSRWDAHRPRRDTGRIGDALAAAGWGDAAAALLPMRTEAVRAMLVPRPGAVETVEALRERGLRVGLISVCAEEVPELWAQTPFADLIEEPVFSCSVGLLKPDPRIYRLACDRLGVEPDEAVFVGDGANDELAGAERAGLRAVCVIPPGRDEPFWPEARGWEPTIRELRELLDLI